MARQWTNLTLSDQRVSSRTTAPALKILLLFFLFAHFGSARAENWDRFRGPNGAGQSEATGVPSEWEAENFLWRQTLPGIGHSSPVVWSDRLFILSADEKSGEQIIQSFDAANGKPLWEKRVGGGSYGINGLNSYASSTPAVDARHVYVMWLAEDRVNIGAWTHDGNEVWRRDIGPFKEEHGFGKSPVVVDGLVCVANDSEAESSIVALDVMTGEPRWEIPRPSGNTPFATPCLLDPTSDDKQLVAVSTAAGLAGIDSKTGSVIWQGLKKQIPLRCVSSPVVADGLVFVACGQGGNGKWMIAARPGDSEHDPEEVYRLDKNIPNVPTPIVAGDLLFLWHDRGIVSCHDVATGRQHWRERVGGDFHSSPIRIGDRILGASRSGEVIVLAAEPEFRLLARNVLDEPCHASPAVANDRLYIRTESTLFCIGSPISAGK